MIGYSEFSPTERIFPSESVSRNDAESRNDLRPCVLLLGFQCRSLSEKIDSIMIFIYYKGGLENIGKLI